MLSLTPRLKEPQRARGSTVSTLERGNAHIKIKIRCTFLINVYFIISDHAESNANNSLKYVPGKARSHHLEQMMSKDELEEEQRSVRSL